MSLLDWYWSLPLPKDICQHQYIVGISLQSRSTFISHPIDPILHYRLFMLHICWVERDNLKCQFDRNEQKSIEENGLKFWIPFYVCFFYMTIYTIYNKYI